VDTTLTPMHTSPLEEQAALVALLRERPGGASWIDLTSLVLEHGDVDRARRTLVADDGLFESPEQAQLRAEARADIEGWLAEGLEFWTVLDSRYPARLRDVVHAPPFLFAQGLQNPIGRVDDVGVSVVGSRAASVQGLALAEEIAAGLVTREITVIAGLAAGIDTAAHRTALAAHGRTVAVIGTGIRRHYPAQNRALQDQISVEGLVISQFWPDAPPTKQSFPMRNAIMSGYGIATIVVEAGEHSGARIQARVAVEHGRPVVLTRLVLEATEWAKALIDRPDVYVASSAAEALTIIDTLKERPRLVSEALDQLAV
jgi:DNA processing protein